MRLAKKKRNIKNKIEGLIIDDDELEKDFVFFLFAYYFGWSPEQVDKMSNYQVGVFLEMLPQWIKKNKEADNNGRNANST